MSGGRDTPSSPGEGGVYYEFHQIGRIMRVSAIDAATGIEVVVQGPMAATQAELERIALAKLRRRLASDINRRS